MGQPDIQLCGNEAEEDACMSVRVIYEDVAVGSAAAASVAASSAMGISDPGMLPFGAFAGPVATTEQNQWVLNGTRKVKPASKPVGFWSTQRSGDDCAFETPPTIEISLDGQFTSLGIYFKFDGESGDYCSDLNLTWYNGETQLATQQFFPNSGNYFCEKTVELYNKISIQFNKTNLPNRPVKISLILFGIVREFERQELRSVEATEELNIISDEVAINTLDFTLDSMDDIDFIFQEKQPVYAYNGKTMIGTFYIDDSTRVSKNVYNVSCIDALGILDEDPFAAAMYTNANAKTALEDIVGGHFTLELSEELQTEKLTGYIPDCSRREALQQAAFALRAVVDTSGTGNVKVWRLDESEPEEIPLQRLYTGGDVSTAAIVTEVRVTAHTYSTSGSGSDTVEIGGKTYYHTTAVTTKQNPNITASTKPNVIEVKEAALVNSTNVAAVTQHVFDYYMRRQTHGVQIVMDQEMPGDYVTTTTPWEDQITGTITSMTIKLSGIAAAECEIIGTGASA